MNKAKKIYPSEITPKTCRDGDIIRVHPAWDSSLDPFFYTVVSVQGAGFHLAPLPLDSRDTVYWRFDELSPSWTYHEQGRETTPEYRKWANQVNVNYHDGGMSEGEAELMAGPQPPRFYPPKKQLS